MRRSEIRARIPEPARRAIRRARRTVGTTTSFARAAPDFIIIGGQRCGTTSLYDYLAAHPAIVPAAGKELHYFSLHYDRGFAWYRGHFPLAARNTYVKRRTGLGMVTGEATPYYLFHPLAPARAFERVPEAKLIVLLRDPVTRAFSHYEWVRSLGIETLSFEEALEREPERLQGEEERMASDPPYQSHNHRHFSYLARGVYVDQLQRWRSFFPPEQMLFSRTEDLLADPLSVHESVLRFLGLPSVALPEYPRRNVQDYSDMKPETRRFLVEYFAEANRRLYEYLGRDFGWER